MKIHQGSIAATIGATLVIVLFAFQNCSVKVGSDAGSGTDANNPFQVGKPLPEGEACTDTYAMSAVTAPTCTGGYTVQTATGSVTSGQPQLYIFGIYETDPSAKHTSKRAGEMTVNVPTGTDPVHLVLVSYEPTQWNLTGATGRIAKVIVHSYYCNHVAGVNANLIDYYSHYVSTNELVTRELYGQFMTSEERESLSENNKFPVMSRVAGLLGVTVAKAQYVYRGACAASRTFTAGP